MADNVAITPGVGANIAADDVGGVFYQVTKIDVGGDGVSLPLSAANPMPTTAASLPLPSGAATSALQTTGNASLSSIDGKIPALVSGSQPVTLNDAGGTAISSLASATAAAGLLVATGATEFYFSTSNSSTAQLASGATFTGAVETIVNSQALSVLLTSDQNGTLTIKQYIDAGGTRVSSSIAYAITAGSPFSRCVTANGNYFSLTFRNDGTATTTTLNINTAFGELPAVTSLGNLPVSINESGGVSIAASADPLTGTEAGLLIRQVPIEMARVDFSQVGSSLVTSSMVQMGATGAGMAVSQAGGSLVLTTGTNTNSEFLARTVATTRGAHAFRASVVLSQRIANNNFSVELADLIGTGLAFNNTSATNVDVTIPGNAFTSANVGQSINLSAITTVAGVPGRWQIAAVSGNVVSFTVAGWPGAGSGTLTLWGWSYHRVLFDGTTATNAKYDAQRNGWASGDTTITTATSASPGTIIHVQSDMSDASVADSLRASNTGFQFTTRGSRIENIPDSTSTLYLWVRAWNGTVAPATTTTFTVGYLSIEDIENNKVFIAGGTRNGQGNAITVASSNLSANMAQVGGSNAVTNNGTATAGTLRVVLASDQTTNTNPLLVGGTGATSVGKAEDAVAASGDTGVPAWQVRRDALVVSASASGDYNEMACDKYGATLVRPFERSAKTYRCTMEMAAAASATDIAEIYGNATNTVLVTKVIISSLQTTTGTNLVLLLKRSTANTTGTPTTGTNVPMDSTDAAASTVCKSYTANPTTGTLVGGVERIHVPGPKAADGVTGRTVIELGDKGKGVYLAGTAQGLVVNLGGVTIAGATFEITFEWMELV